MRIRCSALNNRSRGDLLLFNLDSELCEIAYSILEGSNSPRIHRGLLKFPRIINAKDDTIGVLKTVASQIFLSD